MSASLARRWARTIEALAAGATYAEAAAAARVSPARISAYHRDERFSARLALALDATHAAALARLRGAQLRAADVLAEHLDADADARGWPTRALAARDILDRTGCGAPVTPGVSVANAPGGTVQVLLAHYKALPDRVLDMELARIEAGHHEHDEHD